MSAADGEAFNIRSVVDEVLRDTDVVGAEAVADVVLSRIAAADREEALRQSLVGYARVLITRRRHAPIVRDETQQHERSRSGFSAKVAGYRAHARALRDQITVGPGLMKRLGECTFDDLMYAAEVREQQAAANATRAAQYRALGELLQEAGVKTVADLPDDQLGVALDDAA